jgi:hypothetical protein
MRISHLGFANLNHGFRLSDGRPQALPLALALPCASQTQEESSLMILSAWPPKATLGSAPKSPQHTFVNIQFNELAVRWWPRGGREGTSQCVGAKDVPKSGFGSA